MAELRYGKIQEAEAKLKELQAQAEADKGKEGGSMLQEVVTSEDIADVVAKWTGIPVSKMLQSDREKLLNLEAELGKRVAGQSGGHCGHFRCRAPLPGRPAGPQAAHRLVHLPGHHRRGQNRAGQGPGRVPVQR